MKRPVTKNKIKLAGRERKTGSVPLDERISFEKVGSIAEPDSGCVNPDVLYQVDIA